MKRLCRRTTDGRPYVDTELSNDSVGEGLDPPVRGAKSHRAVMIDSTADRNETLLPTDDRWSPLRRH